jgi:hypothetical protein
VDHHALPSLSCDVDELVHVGVLIAVPPAADKAGGLLLLVRLPNNYFASHALLTILLRCDV